MLVDLAAFGHRRPIEQVGHILFKVGALIRIEHTLKDVKPMPGIGVKNVRVKLAVRVKAYRATVIERQRTSGISFNSLALALAAASQTQIGSESARIIAASLSYVFDAYEYDIDISAPDFGRG